MKKVKLAILKNESQDDYANWLKACNDYNDYLDFEVIDLSLNSWLDKLTKEKFDFCLAQPPGLTSVFKQLYDERIKIIDSVLSYPIYPTAREIYLHENKRYLYSWLKANKIPHPETHIFYHKKEAENFIEHTDFPIVAKTNIGASGSGVKIMYNKSEIIDYVKSAFSQKGAPKRWGPNFSKGNILRRGLKSLLNPKDLKKKLGKYSHKRDDKQIGFVIFQKFIPHDFEWRIVAIGNSYFAHKKLKIGEKASGSLLKKYDNPPLRLFDFAFEVMQKHNFYSQALDVFEDENGVFLVNEMQCMFGQSDPYQMLVNNTPGRYLKKGDHWVFEKGDFNKNESYNLRIEHVLKLSSK